MYYLPPVKHNDSKPYYKTDAATTVINSFQSAILRSHDAKTAKVDIAMLDTAIRLIKQIQGGKQCSK